PRKPSLPVQPANEGHPRTRYHRIPPQPRRLRDANPERYRTATARCALVLSNGSDLLLGDRRITKSSQNGKAAATGVEKCRDTDTPFRAAANAAGPKDRAAINRNRKGE